MGREPVAGAGEPRFPEDGFHPRFVAKVEGRLGAEPRNGELVAQHAERNLELFEGPENAIDGAERFPHRVERRPKGIDGDTVIDR
jgi:hypothetical protein